MPLLPVPLILLLLFSTAHAEDWPRWRGPRADGTWLAPQLPPTWPKAGLRQVWRRPVGGGYAGVTVAGGRVYVMDRIHPEQNDPATERVLCFDAATGEPLWTHAYDAAYGDLTYDSGPRAAPTVHDGRVYTLGAIGNVYCLDAVSGAVVWSIDAVGQMNAERPRWGFAASPLIVGDLAILHIGARPGGCLVAVDHRTGAEVWRSGDDPAGYCTPQLTEHRGESLLVTWTPLHVIGVDPRDGQLLWAIPYRVTNGVSIADPVCREGLVLVAGYWEGSKAIRLGENPTDAEIAWEDRMLCGLMSAPLYRHGYVYLLDRRFGVTCVELATGEKPWRDENHQLTPRGSNPQATMIWLDSPDQPDRAMMLNANGELILLRLTPQGFHEQSRTTIIGPTWAHPAYAGHHVFARDDRELVCFSLADQ